MLPSHPSRHVSCTFLHLHWGVLERGQGHSGEVLWLLLSTSLLLVSQLHSRDCASRSMVRTAVRGSTVLRSAELAPGNTSCCLTPDPQAVPVQCVFSCTVCVVSELCGNQQCMWREPRGMRHSSYAAAGTCRCCGGRAHSHPCAWCC